MLRKATFFGTLAGLGFLLGAISGALAAETNMSTMTQHNAPQSHQFQRIEQPLGNKIAVTIGGLGLIGLELWWFLLSKPKSRRVIAKRGIQEVTVTVDGGYEPSQIVVQAGQAVRLNFDRKDPSSCLEEVRFPDFRIAQELPLNQVTSIEFTPDKPGRYEFTCGMNMFRGIVEVQAGEQTPPVGTIPPTLHSVSPTNHHSDHTASSASSLEANMTPDGIQEATITVAKGYQPKRIIVEAGHPVRLQFNRQNLSSCYDQLLIPDFEIVIDLEAETTVEFTPEQAGEYEFMCGMKMNHGVIEVHAPQPANPEKAIA